jgi:hypothetical protein
MAIAGQPREARIEVGRGGNGSRRRPWPGEGLVAGVVEMNWCSCKIVIVMLLVLP